MALEPERVLSIQSHVVSGYVGNRAATFPLQLLGYDVDVINTVQFSNHTGYGYTDGQKTTPEVLQAIFRGLKTNGILHYSRVLTGYVPSAEALKVIADQIRVIKEADETLLYVLDPVMGDVGTGLYVSPDVVPIYREMLSSANIITPNQFEVELLSGVKIDSIASLHAALLNLHVEHSVPDIAFSSIPLPRDIVNSLDLPAPPKEYTRLLPDPLPIRYDPVGGSAAQGNCLVCFASTYTRGQLETWGFALPTLQGYFSGVGDLFASLVLAHYDVGQSLPSSTPLAHAVSRALLTVQQILLKTHLYSTAAPPSKTAISETSSSSHAVHPQAIAVVDCVPTDDELDAAIPSRPGEPKRKAKRMKLRELRLISERHLISETSNGWPGRRIKWIASTDEQPK